MKNLILSLRQKIGENLNAVVSVLLVTLIVCILAGITGIVYLEKRLDWWEDQLGIHANVINDLLIGKKPLIDASVAGGEKGVIPAAALYVNEIKELKKRLEALESKPTPTPKPASKFNIGQ